jgi:hypothetical protein
MISSLNFLKAQEASLSIVVQGYRLECLGVGGVVFSKGNPPLFTKCLLTFALLSVTQNL